MKLNNAIGRFPFKTSSCPHYIFAAKANKVELWTFDRFEEKTLTKIVKWLKIRRIHIRHRIPFIHNRSRKWLCHQWLNSLVKTVFIRFSSTFFIFFAFVNYCYHQYHYCCVIAVHVDIVHVHNVPQVGPNPSMIVCPSCKHNVMTRLEYESTIRTHLIAAALCLLGYVHVVVLICMMYLYFSDDK